MPQICPRPCSGLATGAVFLSVGVVQFVVGIILLRSDYAYLLAGPDFLTSFCNIAVGCLLGISASVWKGSKKRPSNKHIIRRNLILALQFSALIINATTLTILLLGDGNNLLSIRLQGSGVQSLSLNEVLAYAYATSVCSPIVCIVVSIVAMSGNIFLPHPKTNCDEFNNPESILKKPRTESFKWVYSPELLALAKKKIQEAILAVTTPSDSSSDETPQDTPPKRKKYGGRVEDLECILNRMPEDKRDNLLNNTAATLYEIDSRRKHKLKSRFQERSYMGSNLSRSKESVTSSERNYRVNLIKDDKMRYLKNTKSHRSSLEGNAKLSRTSSGYVTLERKRQGRHKPDPPIRSPYVDEVFDENHNPPLECTTMGFATQYRTYQKSRQDAENVSSNRNQEKKDTSFNTIATVHKSPRITRKEDNTDDLIVELKQQCNNFIENRNAVSNKVSFSAEIHNDNVVGSPSSIDCFSPEGSDFTDSFDFNRTGSWAGEFVPILTNNTSARRMSEKLIPVPNPVVPINREMEGSFIKRSPDIKNESDSTNDDEINTKKLASFRENGRDIRNGSSPEYPKGSQHLKKYDLTKMATMSSISEEPSAVASGTSSSARDDDGPSNESSSSSGFASLSNKKSLASAYLESTKTNLHQDRGSENGQEKDCGSENGKEKTPRSKTSASCKTIRRIWSSVGSDKEVDILDQVVDTDSLIGLSEEELIARQTRTRSIRQAVEQRIKGGEIAA